jgi:hypothetical protein
MTEQIFRNMLVFLSRATAVGANEARALCECVDAVTAILAAPAPAVPVPSIPEPPTNGGERMRSKRPPVLTLVKKAA